MSKVFITGGTSGIGLELSKLYLEEGHEVGVCGRDLSRYPEDIRKLYPLLSLYTVDIVERENVIKAITEFAGEEGLDLLVASAGRSVGKKSSLPDFDACEDVIKTNVLGVVYSFEAAVKSMLVKKSGHLVAISSIAGMVGLPGAAAYSASKAAILKICESFSMDLAPQGIKVTAIAPGFIDTPLTQENNHSMPFMMPAKKGALKIKKAIDKKMAFYVFPVPMQIFMFVLERLPRFIYRKIMGRLQSTAYKK